jgi:hypothetical protein
MLIPHRLSSKEAVAKSTPWEPSGPVFADWSPTTTFRLKTMSKTNFIAINPESYTATRQVSKSRHPGGQTPDISFEQQLRQIRTHMDMTMAQVLFDNDTSDKPETDLLSQTLNLEVLATLSKLSGHQAHPLASQALPTPGTTTDAVRKNDLHVDEHDARTRVDELARSMMAEHGARVQESPDLTPKGILSRHFESRDQCNAIGYDRQGGTSYGIYQISSRQGTMDQFIDFLRREMPSWASQLDQAGPADTGSDQGAMPEAWRAIAREDPQGFSQMQHRFITRTHYLPALGNILQLTGLTEDLLSPPLREVIFSTAVHHGPTGAVNIFRQAWDRLDPDDADDLTARLLDQVYAIRKTRFSGSTSQVQAAVANRLDQEALLARRLLDSMLG